MPTFSRVSAAAVTVVALAMSGAGLWTESAAAATTTHRTALPTPITTSTVDGGFSHSATELVTYTPRNSGKYKCFVDSQQVSCPSTPTSGSTVTLSLGGLTDTAHTFVLRAIGGGKPATYRHTWSVDTTPPPAPVIEPVPARTSDAVVRWTEADPQAQTACTYTGPATSSPTACPSPARFTLPTFADGDYTATVVATDEAGNHSVPASVSWTLDHSVAPGPSLVDNQPLVFGGNTPVSVGFDSPAGTASVTCTLTDSTGATVSTTTPCTSPWTPSSTLADGTYTLTITAYDANGQQIGPALQVVFTVDRTPPAAPTIESGPATATPLTDATFAVTNHDGLAQLLCSIDQAAYAACPVGMHFTGFTNGGHRFAVLARDAAGNDSAAPTFDWTVDPNAAWPATFDSGPANPSSDNPARFLFHDLAPDNVANTFRCRLDGGSWFTCDDTDATSVSLGAQGAHVFQVEVGYNSSTTWSAPVSWSWTYSTGAPVSGQGGATGGTGSTGGTGGSVATSPGSGSAGPGTPVVSVSIATPTTLAGVTKVAFSGNVSGVSSSTVGLVVAGNATSIAATRACFTGTGAATACSSNVRKVVLTPKAALISGQRYVAAVSGVRDGANRVVSASKAFRAALRQEQSGAGVTPAWRKVSAKPAYGGAYVTSASRGDTVAYRFTGTSVTWYTLTGAAQGVAGVYVDGVRKATIDNSAATTHARVARTVRGLRSGAHTLTVLVTGKAGARGSHGRSVSVDAVRFAGKTVANPALVQRWVTVRTSHASGGSYTASAQKSAALTLVFRGTTVTWSTVRGKAMGQAAVYVDGVRKATVDNFATTTKYAVARVVKNLSDRVHTLRIVVLGKHHAGGTGNVVAVDRFVVS